MADRVEWALALPLSIDFGSWCFGGAVQQGVINNSAIQRQMESIAERLCNKIVQHNRATKSRNKLAQQKDYSTKRFKPIEN